MSGLEMTHVDGRRYSTLRIPEIHFIGIADWSPNHRFGLAVGSLNASQSRIALLIADGEELWRSPVGQPFDVQITDDCSGVFEDGGKLVFFHSGGILFKVEQPPGLGKITDYKVMPQGLMVYGGRLMVFAYDMAGRLIAAGRDDAAFYAGLGGKYMRGDRYREAEDFLAHEDLDKAKAMYLLCVKDFMDSPNHRADILRRLGEISLRQDKKSDAILYWGLALKANPKVGIKKKLDKLKKEAP